MTTTSHPFDESPAERLKRLEDACRAEPFAAKAWRALGGALAELQQYEPARRALHRALTLEPTDDACRSLQGYVLNELGDTRGALAVLSPHALEEPMSFSRRVRHGLLLPYIYDSGDAQAAWRQRYTAALTELARVPQQYCATPTDVLSLGQTNFLLAYQGEDDLPLQRSYAGLLAGLIGQARPELQAEVAGAGQARIRVLFVSAFLRDCTIGHYFRSWIEDLDPTRFEVMVLDTAGIRDDVADSLAASAARHVRDRGDALRIATHIRELRPDILIYPEVGMHSRNYLLANMRLAPVQCAAWGHPVTTGSSFIDYYFTSADMEPEAGDSHYAERLLRLPGLGTRYRRPSDVEAGQSREAFGLSGSERFYICPQSLFKIHPDNDDLFLDLMEADPEGIFAFFQEGAPALTNAFAARLARRMAARGMPPRKQMRFLPRVTPAQFRAIVGLADVVLDTLHWSGGNSSLDAFSVGTPVVALPGRFMRGRQTQAMLKTLGVPELIVADRQAYVTTAVAIAGDRAMAADLRQRILAGQGALYDRSEPVAALADHLQAAFEAARR